MTEKKFWQRLKRLLPMVHWQRIESVTASGIPDVNGCYQGFEFWLELKVLTGVKALSFQSPLKPLQSAWLLKRWKSGGRVFVCALYNDEIWLYPGVFGPRLVTNKDLQDVGTLVKLKKPWDKTEFLNALISDSPEPALNELALC